MVAKFAKEIDEYFEERKSWITYVSWARNLCKRGLIAKSIKRKQKTSKKCISRIKNEILENLNQHRTC